MSTLKILPEISLLDKSEFEIYAPGMAQNRLASANGARFRKREFTAGGAGAN